MDYFVDKHSLLPVITFGDFSKEELFHFFRYKSTRSPVVKGASKTNMADHDDNPFLPLVNKDSSDSLVGHVDSLNLTSTTSFPDLPSTSGTSSQVVNRNQNNDGEDKSKSKHSPNPFDRPAAEENSPMDQESTDTVSSKNSVSSLSPTENTGSTGLFVTPTASASMSNLSSPGASPLAKKRRTRSSTRRPSLNSSGVVLRSATNSKLSKDKVPSPELRQKLANMFTISDMDLSQLVATQSDTTGLKVTIKRKKPTSTRSKNVQKGSKNQNPDNISGHSGLRTPTGVCLQPQAPVAPLPQRTNRRSRNRSTDTPEQYSAGSAAPNHVLSQASAISDTSNHVESDDSVISGTIAHVGSSKQKQKHKQNDTDHPVLLAPTPNSNILNKRLSSHHSSVGDLSPNNSDIISNHLRIIRQAVEQNAFDQENPVPSTSNFNFSQDFQITATENSRKIKNSKNNSSIKNSKKQNIKDWATYTHSINVNPFDQVASTSTSPHVSSKQPVRFQTNPLFSSSTQVANKPGVFKQAQPVLDEYKVTLSKELCLKLHTQMLETQLERRWYPNWSVTYKPPPAIINTEQKVNKLVETRENLAREMLKTNLEFYEQLLSEMEAINSSSIDSLEAMYKTDRGKAYNLDEALEKCRQFADDQREKRLDELTKIMEAIRQAPLAALWQGIPEEYNRPAAAVRTPPPPRIDSGPSKKKQSKPNNNNNWKNQNARSRSTNRPSGSQPRNRSTSRSNNNNYNKRRRDEISRYVAQAVTKTVQGMVKDFM